MISSKAFLTLVCLIGSLLIHNVASHSRRSPNCLKRHFSKGTIALRFVDAIKMVYGSDDVVDIKTSIGPKNFVTVGQLVEILEYAKDNDGRNDASPPSSSSSSPWPLDNSGMPIPCCLCSCCPCWEQCGGKINPEECGFMPLQTPQS